MNVPSPKRVYGSPMGDSKRVTLPKSGAGHALARERRAARTAMILIAARALRITRTYCVRVYFPNARTHCSRFLRRCNAGSRPRSPTTASASAPGSGALATMSFLLSVNVHADPLYQGDLVTLVA